MFPSTEQSAYVAATGGAKMLTHMYRNKLYVFVAMSGGKTLIIGKSCAEWFDLELHFRKSCSEWLDSSFRNTRNFFLRVGGSGAR